MKKLLAIIFIVSSFFIIGFQNSEAISNVCLGRGGVNCSAGPALFGYARCYDNSTSPVLYSQLDECFNDSASGCVLPRPVGCVSQTQLNEIQREFDRYKYSCQASKGEIGNEYADCVNFGLQRQLQICQSQIQEYQLDHVIYGNCVRNYYQNILYNASTTYELQKAQLKKSCSLKIGYVWDNTNNKCIVAKLTQASSTNLAQASSTVQIQYLLKIDFGLGSYSNDVFVLQKFLQGKGFLKLPPETKLGSFGPLTKKALTDFQKSIGLPATGYCGPLTRAVINNSR